SCRTRKNCPRWAKTSTTLARACSARRGGITDRPYGRRRIGGAEDRRARDERGRAVVRERLREVGLHAAVHRNIDASVSVAEERADVADLPVGARDERLPRSEEHTSELQSRSDLVCRLLLEKKKTTQTKRRGGQ